MTLQERLPPGKYRLTVEDYVRLADAGAFGDEKTELVGGEIIVMSPEWRPHMRVKDYIAYRLQRCLEDSASPLSVGTGGSVAIGDHAMPRPDIMLTDDLDGEGAVPVASVALAVEISATTLDFDTSTKARLYAAAGLPEYWVVDVYGRVIHQMWNPMADGYRDRREVAFGERIEAATLPGVGVDTDRL